MSWETAMFYLIYQSDLRKKYDRLIGRRVNRAAATKIVRRLNAQAVQDAGIRAPLYYLIRADSDGRGKKMLSLERRGL